MRVYGDSPVKMRCVAPEHVEDTPSLAVYPDHAFCFGCRRYFHPGEFLDLIGASPEGLPAAMAAAKRAYVPKPELPIDCRAWAKTLTDPRSPRHHRLDWFKAKYGLWDDTIEQYLIGHTGSSYSIPIWCDGQIQAVRFRLDPAYTPEWKLAKFKYIQETGTPVMLFRPNPDGAICVVTEGELDALSLAQLGYDAITTTGGSGTLPSRIPRRLLTQKPAYIATDRDGPGDEAYYAINERHDLQLPRVDWPEGKDVSEALLATNPYRRAAVFDSWLRESSYRSRPDDDWD